MESARQGTSAHDPSITSIIGGGTPPMTATTTSTSTTTTSTTATSSNDDEPSLTPESFAPLLKQLVVDPSSVSSADLSRSFLHIASPTSSTPAQVGAFLSALRIHRLDAEPSVVASCAQVMRSKSIKVDLDDEEDEDEGERGPVCDIVGTGGDGHNTFNVSTTAAIVAAGAGARVYKVRIPPRLSLEREQPRFPIA
ncbi:hypothetical protein JCM10212_003203 [Sporobolomyces blumeae]